LLRKQRKNLVGYILAAPYRFLRTLRTTLLACAGFRCAVAKLRHSNTKAISNPISLDRYLKLSIEWSAKVPQTQAYSTGLL